MLCWVALKGRGCQQELLWRSTKTAEHEKLWILEHYWGDQRSAYHSDCQVSASTFAFRIKGRMKASGNIRRRQGTMLKMKLTGWNLFFVFMPGGVISSTKAQCSRITPYSFFLFAIEPTESEVWLFPVHSHDQGYVLFCQLNSQYEN